MSDNATQTADLAPPAGIMPAVGGDSPLVPPAAVIERLRAMANDVAAARLNIGGCPNAGAAFYKMMLGWEHGIRPMCALTEVQIIENRGSLTAAAQAASVEARGLGRIEIVAVNDDGCTVRVTRRDWPADRVELVAYTKADAFAAQFLSPDDAGNVRRDPKTGAALSSKKNWRTNHQDMYVARARGRAYRRWFGEATLGLTYSREELEDLADDNGRPLAVELERSVPPWEAAAKPAASDAVPSASSSPSTPASPAPAAAVQPTPASAPTTPAAPAPAQAAPPAAGSSASPNGLATEYQATRAVGVVRALGLSHGEWQSLMSKHGVKSYRELSFDVASNVLRFLDLLHGIQLLRKALKVPDTDWSAALAKRGVQRAIDLPAADAEAIFARLADRATPFDMADVKRLCPSLNGGDHGPGDVVAGGAVSLGNVPSPPPVSAAA